MEKTIVIPTDLKVESLNVLKHALANNNERVNIILLYAENVSNSIQDLLFYSPSKIINKAASQSFYDGLAIIKNRYDTHINSLRIEVLHSDSKNLLKRFIEANNISQVVLPQSYELVKSKNGFDLVALLKTCTVPVEEVLWESKVSVSELGRLDSLFQ
jgi:hypothetical protein